MFSSNSDPDAKNTFTLTGETRAHAWALCDFFEVSDINSVASLVFVVSTGQYITQKRIFFNGGNSVMLKY